MEKELYLKYKRRREFTNLNVRVPKELIKIIEKLVEHGLYSNISEFVRESLREKLNREAPSLVKELLEEW
ncbi:MAG: ribbon-helix-helix domain-containing protein [candidate division WOR-3 bacterium]